MANNSQRMWIAIPAVDGVVLARFPNAQYNPRLLPHEQLGIADFLEKMPAGECFELSATLAVAGNQSMKNYANHVRSLKLRKANQFLAAQPPDPVELAKLSAMMEGTLLDPDAGLEETQQALNSSDPDNFEESNGQ